MTEPHRPRVKYVIGPDGSQLTIADLPAPGTKRWVIRRKAEVVAAVRGGLLSLEEVFAVEEHLEVCDQCRTESAELSEVSSFLAGLTSDQVRSLAVEFAPKRQADATLLGQAPLFRTALTARSPNPEAPSPPEARPKQPRSARRRQPASGVLRPRHRSQFVLAAAAVALVVGIGVGMWLTSASPAAVTLADSSAAQAIVAITRGGTTARWLSALRPRAPATAPPSPNSPLANRMNF
jgi:anti-sigma factor RsiW